MTKTVVVTGAGSGIGAACCAKLADQGYCVAAVDVDEQRGVQTAAGLPGTGHRAFRCDVADSQRVRTVHEMIVRDLGLPYALVTCAGGSPNTHARRPAIWEMPSEEWQRTVDVNLGGTFNFVASFLKARSDSAMKGGRIVTLSSISARMGQGVTGAAYAAAKAGILGLTRVAALEAARLGVTVNSIAPGPVDTPAFRRANDQSQFEAMLGRIPAGRIGTPAEIAAAVAFLLSDEAGFITGASLDMNGGMVMH